MTSTFQKNTFVITTRSNNGTVRCVIATRTPRQTKLDHSATQCTWITMRKRIHGALLPKILITVACNVMLCFGMTDLEVTEM